jgi:hypothetical protein
MTTKRDQQIPESLAALTLLIGMLLAIAYVVTDLRTPPPPTPKQRMQARAERAPMPRQLNVVRILKVGDDYIREDTRKRVIWMSLGKEDILPDWDVDPRIYPPGMKMPDLERAWLDCKPGVTKFTWQKPVLPKD